MKRRVELFLIILLPILGLVFLGGKIMTLTKRPEQKVTVSSSKKVVQKSEEEIKKASKDWILLFQMDTVESDNYELMFGDCGHLYFWIKKEDLANKNFENIWLILQCC